MLGIELFNVLKTCCTLIGGAHLVNSVQFVHQVVTAKLDLLIETTGTRRIGVDRHQWVQLVVLGVALEWLGGTFQPVVSSTS
jgi:hypothetical protein